MSSATYFWTNTPTQTLFIFNCADVNRLNSHINDPNLSDEQIQVYQQQFAEAKDEQRTIFSQLFLEWADWLDENLLAFPTMGKAGTISAKVLDASTPAISMKVLERSDVYNGKVYSWQDFFRTMALQAFVLRTPPGPEHAAYDPETHFHD